MNWSKPTYEIKDSWVFISRENASIYVVRLEEAESAFADKHGFDDSDRRKLLKMQTGDFLDCVQWVVIRK